MKKSIFKYLILVVFVIGLSVQIFAQTGQTGTLGGTVTDNEGLPLPGVGCLFR